MSDDKMQVGKVKLGTSASPAFSHVWCPTCHAYHTSDLHPPALPKLPKRVAVQASVYADRLTVRIVITANDGTVWLRSRDNWEQLPDLPQE